MPPAKLKKDNPHQIVEFLLDKHGDEDAYNAALAGALEAQAEGDNYRLSVWRETASTIFRRAATTKTHE